MTLLYNSDSSERSYCQVPTRLTLVLTVRPSRTRRTRSSSTLCARRLLTRLPRSPRLPRRTGTCTASRRTGTTCRRLGRTTIPRRQRACPSTRPRPTEKCRALLRATIRTCRRRRLRVLFPAATSLPVATAPRACLPTLVRTGCLPRLPTVHRTLARTRTVRPARTRPTFTPCRHPTLRPTACPCLHSRRHRVVPLL